MEEEDIEEAGNGRPWKRLRQDAPQPVAALCSSVPAASRTLTSTDTCSLLVEIFTP